MLTFAVPVVKQQLTSMKKKSPFEKFIKKKSNAAVKEQFRQEKKKWKKEREEFFDKKRSQKSEVRNQHNSTGRGSTIPPSHFRPKTSNQMPLNKFIAHCGVCARRDAAELVKTGVVKVNGQVITEPGHKVSARDEIKVNGKKIFLEKNLVYILLNKPKDFITTTDDPQGRKTVLDLVRRATSERVYPVGRLDRNTSGVLLLTNDGELSQKLTHPSNEIKKIYAVTLNRPLDKNDFDKIIYGLILEDGPASVDKLAYSDTRDHTQIGVEIHSGRNRIVRRIFEHLGYEVKHLDRVMFAGLTKKNVERGKWRFLTEKEVRTLKYFSPPKPSKREGFTKPKSKTSL
jgi:23S rRNA pseudouridine2605 synthase